MNPDFVDVLVVTPPTWGRYQCSASLAFPAYPPVDSVPLRLAQTARNAGFETAFLPLAAMMIHYNATMYNSMCKVMSVYKPKLVIISSDYHIGDRAIGSYRSSLEVTRAVSELWPECSTLLTGKLSCVVRGEVLEQDPNLTAAYAGEPEGNFEQVASALMEGRECDDPALIRRESGQIVDPGGYNYVKDVDELPVPAYDLLVPHIDQINRMTRRQTRIVDISLRTSYGCPFSCRFCANLPHWHDVRRRSLDMMQQDLDAMDVLKETAQLRWLDDEVLCWDQHRVRQIADILDERSIRVQAVLTSTGHMSDEIARQLARFTDCVMFGAENSSPEVLKTANKPFTFDQLKTSVAIAKKHGLNPRLEWIIGLPGETMETAMKNLTVLFNMVLSGEVGSIGCYILTPDPGTEFSRNPEKYGMKILCDDLKYQGQNNNFPVYELDGLSAQQIFVYYLTSELVLSQAMNLREMYKSAGLSPPISEVGNRELFAETMARFETEAFAVKG